MAQGADQASVTRAINSVAARTAVDGSDIRTGIAVDLFLKRDDIF